MSPQPGPCRPGARCFADAAGRGSGWRLSRQEPQEAAKDEEAVFEELLIRGRQLFDGHPLRDGRVVARLHLGRCHVPELEVVCNAHQPAACASARMVKDGRIAQCKSQREIEQP